MKTSTILIIAALLAAGVGGYFLFIKQGSNGTVAGAVIKPPITVSKQSALQSIAGNLGSIGAQAGEKWLEGKFSSWLG